MQFHADEIFVPRRRIVAQHTVHPAQLLLRGGAMADGSHRLIKPGKET